MQITWLGHASFKIAIGGQVLLIDPWLTGNPMLTEDQHDAAVEGAGGERESGSRRTCMTAAGPEAAAGPQVGLLTQTRESRGRADRPVPRGGLR